jgi:arabinogalactan endo-1,4-beta-galactosidase
VNKTDFRAERKWICCWNQPGTTQNYYMLGNDTTPGTLSQTVATTPGMNYLLSFWFNNSFGDPGLFSMS